MLSLDDIDKEAVIWNLQRCGRIISETDRNMNGLSTNLGSLSKTNRYDSYNYTSNVNKCRYQYYEIQNNLKYIEMLIPLLKVYDGIDFGGFDTESIYSGFNRLKRGFTDLVSYGFKLAGGDILPSNMMNLMPRQMRDIINGLDDVKDTYEDYSGNQSSYSKFRQPTPSYNAVYPLNKTQETPGGHIFIQDDTDGAKLTMYKHPSGSIVYINDDGTFTIQSAKDMYRVVADDDNLHVKGQVNIIIDGNANVDIGGNANVDIGGRGNIKTAGDLGMVVGGNLTGEVDGVIDLHAKEGVSIWSEKGTNWKSDGGIDFDVFGNIRMKTTNGNIELN